MFELNLSKSERKAIGLALVWLENGGFFNALRESTYEVHDWINAHSKEAHKHGYSFSWGQTKYVIVIASIDWVLKINDPRSVAHRDRDFVNVEAEVYAEALKRNLQEYFAQTYYYVTVDEFDVILQQRVYVDGDYFYNIFCDYVAGSLDPNDYENEDDFNDAVSEDVGDLDASEELHAVFGNFPKALLDLVKDYDLNDFHNENFGLLEGEEPVLIDFCGY